MSIRVVRLGSDREAPEGLRIGTVRRPPRGVRKERLAAENSRHSRIRSISPSVVIVPTKPLPSLDSPGAPAENGSSLQ
jgi:uncharacterized protein YeaO (DUF488 family)